MTIYTTIKEKSQAIFHKQIIYPVSKAF